MPEPSNHRVVTPNSILLLGYVNDEQYDHAGQTEPEREDENICQCAEYIENAVGHHGPLSKLYVRLALCRSHTKVRPRLSISYSGTVPCSGTCPGICWEIQ